MIKIKMIKTVVVKDCENNIQRIYNVGDVLEATGDHGHYWMAGPGIYKDEAIQIHENKTTPDMIDFPHIVLSNTD